MLYHCGYLERYDCSQPKIVVFLAVPFSPLRHCPSAVLMDIGRLRLLWRGRLARIGSLAAERDQPCPQYLHHAHAAGVCHFIFTGVSHQHCLRTLVGRPQTLGWFSE